MTRYLLGLTLPLYIVDQISKWLIVENFPPPGESSRFVPVIEGFFYIVRVHNTGIAFGRFNGESFANPLFSAVAIMALAALLYLWKRKDAFPTRTGKVAASLIVSGILGNVTDRLVHGFVVDFLHFELGFMTWPSFNVADSCICIAAGLMVLSAFQAPASSKAGKTLKESPDPEARP